MSDLMIHGYSPDGWAIVRYDRRGKWFKMFSGSRQQITVDEAARLAADGKWFEGKPGGRTFDARVRRIVEADKDTSQPHVPCSEFPAICDGSPHREKRGIAEVINDGRDT